MTRFRTKMMTTRRVHWDVPSANLAAPLRLRLQVVGGAGVIAIVEKRVEAGERAISAAS